MSSIDKANPIPLYYQIVRDISAQIESQKLNPGDKLPTEQWLVEHYNVSRVTVRKALSDLLAAELIERERGKGPVVARPKINRDVSRLTGLQQEIAKAGLKSTSVISDISYITAQGKIAEKMNVREGEPLIRFHRLRFGDDMPIADQIIYLRECFCKGFNPMDLQEKSLFEILENDYGLKIDYAHQTMSVKVPSKRQVEELDLPDKTGLLCMKRTTFLSSGEAVEYTEISYVSNRYELSMTLYR